MTNTGRLAPAFAAVVAAVLLGAGCVAREAPRPSPPMSEASAAVASAYVAPSTPGNPSESRTLAGSAVLVVLADGFDGVPGLWALDADASWTLLGAMPGATAVGRTADGVAVATGHTVDRRGKSALAAPGIVTTLKWPGAAPAAPIAGLDGSPLGRLALVAFDYHSDPEYGVVDADGTVSALTPAPTDTFAPVVSWLDEDRVLVLTMDKWEISRLAIIDTGTHTMDTLMGVGGWRWFAVSADRRTVAAARDDFVDVGSISSFEDPNAPHAFALEAGQTVWALALDADGSRMFMLSGTEAPDGQVNSVHELEYAIAGSSWTKVLDVPVPFGRGIGQVCLD